jgi:hypothetical protein
MPADEKTRLRIRQHLIELMDEQAADAMMESMPPIPWTDLATKDDIAQLTARMDGIDARFDRVDARFGTLNGSVDTRFDAAATMAVMLVVFIVGTIASLIAAGAFG